MSQLDLLTAMREQQAFIVAQQKIQQEFISSQQQLFREE